MDENEADQDLILNDVGSDLMKTSENEFSLRKKVLIATIIIIIFLIILIIIMLFLTRNSEI